MCWRRIWNSETNIFVRPSKSTFWVLADLLIDDR
jgi:hypothetical protein